MFYKMLIKKRNKRAWLKIMEAFLAILMVVSVLSVIVMSEFVTKDDGGDKIHEQEFYVLQEIQLNSSLRQNILGLNSLPIESSDPGFNFNFQSLIEASALTNFNCSLKVCILNSECDLNNPSSQENVYVNSMIISSNQTLYNPKQIKIFCWRD